MVRCANCGHIWHRPPPLMIPDKEPAAPLAAPRIVPGLEVPPRPGPLPVPTPPRLRRRRAVGWTVLGALFGLLLLAGLAAIIARREVVAMWPATARIYAVAGLSAAPFGSDLELAKIAPTRTTDGLVIEGDITNTGSTARDVPRLRVALRDPGEKVKQFKIIDPPVARLEPVASRGQDGRLQRLSRAGIVRLPPDGDVQRALAAAPRAPDTSSSVVAALIDERRNGR